MYYSYVTVCYYECKELFDKNNCEHVVTMATSLPAVSKDLWNTCGLDPESVDFYRNSH